MVLNPFELNGYEFLLFYSLILTLISIMTWTFRPKSSGRPLVNPERLRLEHWAILAGGLPRAAEAVFTRSLVDGTIVWNEVELRYQGQKPDSQDPAVQMLQTQARLPMVMKALERSCSLYEKDLQNWGLLQTADELADRQFKISLAYTSLLLIGLVRIFQGLLNDKPVGFLVLLMILAALLWFASIRRCTRKTREGVACLHEFATRFDHIRRAPPQSEMPLAVALGGVSALNGSEYGHLIWSLDPMKKRLESMDGGIYSVMDSSSVSDSGGFFGGDSGDSGSSGDGGGSGCGGCGGD